MENKVFQRIQTSLLEKRQFLNEWLRSTPAPQKRVYLGPVGEGAVQDHLKSLNTALEKVEDNTLGLCTVCNDYVNTSLLEMDYNACVCLEHFSEQERRELESELEFLQVVQRASLPQEPPSIPGLDLAAFSRPAQIVGGDYFDFFRYRDGAHGLAIADAMGHGVSATLLISKLQTALRTLVPEHDSPAEVLQRVNRVFLHYIELTTFVTVILCRYDPTRRLLTYCNAGHNPALFFLGQAGDVAWLQPTGAAIGLVEEYTPTEEEISLSSGDVLVLYTDGVTEATNSRRESFGQERLAALVRQKLHISARDLQESLRVALHSFTNGRPLEDDTTIVVCKMG